jgi:hypothetical protein
VHGQVSRKNAAAGNREYVTNLIDQPGVFTAVTARAIRYLTSVEKELDYAQVEERCPKATAR